MPKHPGKKHNDKVTNDHASTGEMATKVFDHRSNGEPVETRGPKSGDK